MIPVQAVAMARMKASRPRNTWIGINAALTDIGNPGYRNAAIPTTHCNITVGVEKTKQKKPRTSIQNQSLPTTITWTSLTQGLDIVSFEHFLMIFPNTSNYNFYNFNYFGYLFIGWEIYYCRASLFFRC